MGSQTSEVPARSEIKIGQRVWAIEKKNYGTDDLTEGVVQRILTSTPFHPRGIKVMLSTKGGSASGGEDGTVARVQRLTPPEEKMSPPTPLRTAEPETASDLDSTDELR